MQFIKILIIFLFFVSGNLKSFSQEDFNEVSDIKILFDKLYFAQTDSVKNSINMQILTYMKDYLQEKHNIIEDFEDVKNLYVLESDDNYISILTWAIQYSNSEYKYFGFLKYFDRNGIVDYVEKLNDNMTLSSEYSSNKVYPENWYGAVYYKIITKKYKKKRHYVLLGWDANDNFTNKRILDVLFLEDDETPIFGKNVIDFNNKFISRIVFEYNERSSMMLRFDKKQDMIIWDHLSPSKQELRGHYRYYGPDLSFDALKYEKGIWKFMSDIEIMKK